MRVCLISAAVLLLITAAVLLLILVPGPALAKWWIVRSSDETCLVVDVSNAYAETQKEGSGVEEFAKILGARLVLQARAGNVS